MHPIRAGFRKDGLGQPASLPFHPPGTLLPAASSFDGASPSQTSIMLSAPLSATCRELSRPCTFAKQLFPPNWSRKTIPSKYESLHVLSIRRTIAVYKVYARLGIAKKELRRE